MTSPALKPGLIGSLLYVQCQAATPLLFLVNHRLIDQTIELSLKTGGCIKFDLKAWDENLYVASTGNTNKRTLENFKRSGEKIHQRAVPPLLIANTLLVPGYIDEDEIRYIARFIASINPDIPYSMLAFYPHFT